jgi:glutamine synthetase
MAQDGVTSVLEAIQRTPIIDNHAHPLLKRSAQELYPLQAIASEAHGDAIVDSHQSLAHTRVVNQLSRALGCRPTWEAVAEAIKKRRLDGYDDWVRTCMKGIALVLVDDGLDQPENAEPWHYFDDFTGGHSRRIVRIEATAARLIEDASMTFIDAKDAFTAVTGRFEREMETSVADREVVGFKSVICYRTGLAVPPEKDVDEALKVFVDIHRQIRADTLSNAGRPFTRVNHRGLNEYFVHLLAEVIRGSNQRPRKPVQFHTGLGDNDITLTSASPSHLQPFIRAYPDVPVVLLHAGYPFTRELGYLAAMYSNVYADIGEVFPFLSRDGQESVIRQILELCPHSKIMWSTDGHWFPETYFVAVQQMREALSTILPEYVRKGDLTPAQAVELVEDILFNNANRAYGLDLHLKDTKKEVAAMNLRLENGVRLQEEAIQSLSKYMGGQSDGEDEPKFLRIYWNDMTATPRMRSVPMRRVIAMLRNGEKLSFGVTKASMGLIQVDMPAAGVSPSGEYRLHPDLKTLRPGPRKGQLVARGDFREQDGSPVDMCPRTLLKRTLGYAESKNLKFLLGFEIELVIMRRVDGGLEPLDTDGHAWSVGRAMDHDAAIEVLEPAIAALDEAGVYIDVVHPESAPGQFEVVLPKAPPLEAVDTLLYARDVLSAHASAKGYRMTLHPKPFAMACGTAAHVHISISSPNGSDASVYEAFYAGVLFHLRAISAFTYSSVASYERVLDGTWSGGTHIGWGTQNRETPLRKVEGSHWEVKCMDGIANPYLALSAIIGAGVRGVVRRRTLTWRDCGDVAPFELPEAGRRALGIVSKIPGSLGEALEALQADGELVEVMGRTLVDRYVAVKEAEIQFLKGMSDPERRTWVMERY